MGGGDSVVFSLCVNDWEKGIRSDVMGVMDRTVSGLLSAANGWQKRGSDTRQPGSELCPARLGQEVDVCESLSGPRPYPCSFSQARGHKSRVRNISWDGHDLVEQHVGILMRRTSGLPSKR